jgi:hypothetical protein
MELKYYLAKNMTIKINFSSKQMFTERKIIYNITAKATMKNSSEAWLLKKHMTVRQKATNDKGRLEKPCHQQSRRRDVGPPAMLRRFRAR